MQLSKNFTLEEMLYSDTAKRKGIRNDMHDPATIVPNLKALCENVLQPTRDHFGPLIVSSGYSNAKLSLLLGRKLTSQHYRGMAADIVSNKVKNYEIAKWIKANLDFDQLIYEVRRRGVNGPFYDWVHVSYRADGLNRKQTLYSPPGGGYREGLPEKSYV